MNIMRPNFRNMQMTTVLLSDAQSLSKLFYLLSLFDSCSCLKLNQTKSEMLWLGSVRHRKDTIVDLQMSGESVYVLGVHFTNDLEVSEKKFFWHIRIFKEISPFFICSVMSTLHDFCKELNKIALDFIWNHKLAKVKKTTLRPSPLFSLFSVLRPTQIFAFAKKQLLRRQWRQWHIVSNNFYFNLKHTDFFALQIFSLFPDLVWF